jgi:hypothetical protein
MREGFDPVNEDSSNDLAGLQDAMEGSESGDFVDEEMVIWVSSDEEHDNYEDEDDNEDKLGSWVYDKSTAIYEVVRAPAPSENEITEKFDTAPSSPPPSSPSSMSDLVKSEMDRE